MVAWAESMPPSSACSQLHSWMFLVTWRWVVRHGRPLELRRRRHVLLRTHVGPDDAAQLDGGVGSGGHLGRKVAVLRLVHHVHALPVHVELPAVVHAAQAAVFVAAQPQRHQAVRAELVKQADAPVGVAECHQFLAQQLDPNRLSVRLRQLPGQQGGHPVAAHQFAHGRACPDLRERHIFCLRNHSAYLLWMTVRVAANVLICYAGVVDTVKSQHMVWQGCKNDHDGNTERCSGYPDSQGYPADQVDAMIELVKPSSS